MSTSLNYQDTDQDYRKEFDSEIRGRNLLDEIQEYIAEISGIYAIEGLYKYGKPGQMAFVLRDAIMKNDVHDQDEAMEILLAFVKTEVEARRELGQDEYLKSRGLMAVEDYLDEAIRIAKANGEGLEYTASENTYLGNALKARIEGQVRGYRFEQIAKIGRFAEKIAEGSDKEHDEFLKEMDKIHKRNEELGKRASTTIQRGLAIFKRNLKETRRVAKAISGSLKKLKKENILKANKTRSDNFYGSKEGKKAISEFHKNVQYYSLATRMAMGQQTERKPSQVDKKIADDCVKNLILSGSIAKTSFLKHMASARIKAATHVIKNSKNPKVSRKPPSAQKIKSRLNILALDYDVMINGMLELQKEGKLNTQSSRRKAKTSTAGVDKNDSNVDKAIKVLREALDPNSISKEMRATVIRRVQKIKKILRNPELAVDTTAKPKDASSSLESKTNKLKNATDEQRRNLSKALKIIRNNRNNENDPKL